MSTKHVFSETPPRLKAEFQQFDASLPVEEALTPPASWYTLPEFLAWEKQAVFARSFQIVGSLDRLPELGSFFSGTFFGWPYLVVRTPADEIKAFFNVCSHHGTCVAQGEGKTEKLVCPYHGWTYDLDGQLRKAPQAGNIAHFAKMGLDLKPIPLSLHGRFIALRFGRDEATAAEAEGLKALAELDDSGLQFVCRREYPMACNWKVFIDNYLDGGYHVSQLHPDLAADLDLDGYRSEIFDQHVIQSCGGLANQSGRVGDRAKYLWTHPNFCANRYGPWLDTNWVIPTGPNTCTVVFDYFHHGELPQADLAELLAASDKVQQEDMFICEQVQRGVESGIYTQGIYAPKFEKPMLHFHKLLAGPLLS